MNEINVEKEPQEPRRISEVEPIHETSHKTIFTRQEIKSIVEAPLVVACEELYDKNIPTNSTSANKNNIGLGYAFIIIDARYLSEKNREIGLGVGELDDKTLMIKIPLNENSTTDEVKNQAESIAHKFVKQIMTWVPHYTIEEMRATSGIDPKDESYGLDYFTKAGYYYDPEYKLFFINEEHFKKATEEIEE